MHRSSVQIGVSGSFVFCVSRELQVQTISLSVPQVIRNAAASVFCWLVGWLVVLLFLLLSLHVPSLVAGGNPANFQ